MSKAFKKVLSITAITISLIFNQTDASGAAAQTDPSRSPAHLGQRLNTKAQNAYSCLSVLHLTISELSKLALARAKRMPDTAEKGMILRNFETANGCKAMAEGMLASHKARPSELDAASNIEIHRLAIECANLLARIMDHSAPTSGVAVDYDYIDQSVNAFALENCDANEYKKLEVYQDIAGTAVRITVALAQFILQLPGANPSARASVNENILTVKAGFHQAQTNLNKFAPDRSRGFVKRAGISEDWQQIFDAIVAAAHQNIRTTINTIYLLRTNVALGGGGFDLTLNRLTDQPTLNFEPA